MSVNANLRLAVVLPVYNVDRYLRECLDSLLVQTYSNFTVFAVNDGSTDQSGLILDEYATTDNRIIVIHKQNGGVCSARNTALDKIEGDNSYDYVSFIDPDDYVSNKFVETFLTNVERFKADYAVCEYQPFDKLGKTGGKKTTSSRLLDRDDIILHTFRISRNNWKHVNNDSAASLFLGNKIFKASLIKGLRFDKQLPAWEDCDFFLRAANLLSTGVVIPETMYFYRMRASSLSKGEFAHAYDHLIFEKLFNNRKQFPKSAQAGIQHMYLTLLLQELHRRLVSTISQDEKKAFFAHCKEITSQNFDFPFDRLTKQRISKLRFGYVFSYLYARLRHKRTVQKKQHKKNSFFP